MPNQSVLLSFPPCVLGDVWPADRVVIGLRVCKQLRMGLMPKKYIPCGKIILVQKLGETGRTGYLENGSVVVEEKVRVRAYKSPAYSLRLTCSSCGLSLPDETFNGQDHFLFCKGCGAVSTHPYARDFQRWPWPKRMVDLKLTQCSSHLRVLGACRSLTHLRLSGIRMGPDEASTLASELPACKALVHLDLSSNRLDGEAGRRLGHVLPDLPCLAFLDVSVNSLACSGVEGLAKGLMHSKTLTHLDLRENSFSVDGMEWLSKAMRTWTTLTFLDIQLNPIRERPAGTAHLAKGLEKCQALTALYAGTIRLTGFEVMPVAAALRDCTALTRLALGSSQRSHWQPHRFPGNNLGNAGATHLANVLKDCPSLQELELDYCAIEAEGATRVAEALAGRLSVKVCRMSGNRILSEGVCSLAEALGGTGVTELGLSSVGMCAEGARRLGAVLGQYEALTELDLSFNMQFGAMGMGALANAMQRTGCPSLTKLNVASCMLQDDGAAQLAAALATCPAVRDLNVGDNDLTVAGLRALTCPPYQTLGALSTFVYNRNTLCEESLTLLGGVLGRARPLCQLELAQCRVNEAGAGVLAGMVGGTHTTLTHLNLNDNPIGAEGVRVLADALAKCKGLTQLEVEGNQLDAEGAMALGQVLRASTALTSLSLSQNWPWTAHVPLRDRMTALLGENVVVKYGAPCRGYW